MTTSSDPADARVRSTRERILAVAEPLFAQHGYAGVGLAEVADGVGLRKSSLFHHFATKRALYDAVQGQVVRRLEARLGPVARGQPGPAERLDRWIDAMVDALAERPTTARLVLRGLLERVPDPDSPEPPAYETALDRVIQDLQALLREGVAALAFRDVSVGHAVQTVLGATVYHFASAGLGESVIRAPLFCAAEVEARKREIKQLLAAGLAAGAQRAGSPAQS